ncbi:tRNA glutamyl-Q(34) synthetase GluQRS [Pseudoalteromonas sp. T1lg65]|uniref:tRNA glutamyl-Q(34) synthetase GluQRS n=1 Tax=Pseudoalteromonas sp. T1lg65 TaxID=2077101 RepID=UPI003F78B915
MSPNAEYFGSYRGRFAPSPSGPLHFGSLVAALASYLDAKAHHGQWLVRIEDIDTPRMIDGADSDILATLDAYGLHWDGTVVYQSQRHALYQDTLNTLNKLGLVYPCQCTRKEIKAMGGLYDNRCRNKSLPQSQNAIRIEQHFPITGFNDAIQGRVDIPPSLAHEDYIIRRRDGLFAYQLVVVVDDIEQGITHIVRGADLLEPTARQISLFNQLKQSVPFYSHVPLAVAKPGFKLSKQNHAPAINKTNPMPTLHAALRFLGQPVDSLENYDSSKALLQHAVQNYDFNRLPKVPEIQVRPTAEDSFEFIPVHR